MSPGNKDLEFDDLNSSKLLLKNIGVKNKYATGKNVEKADKKKKEPESQIPYSELFRYATGLDYLYLFIGTISAAAHGVAMPVLFIFFGDVTDSFVNQGTYSSCNYTLATCISMGIVPNTTTPTEFEELIADSMDFEGTVARQSIIFSILACAVWVFGWMQVTFWCLPASRQVNQIRITFYRAILRQNIGFFDLNSAGELNTRLADDVNQITDGMNDKVSMMIMNLTRAVGGLIIGFVYSWKVSLVILACSPLIGILSGILFKFIETYSTKENDAYAKAGSIAEEVISSIRTVTAFGGQHVEHKRYEANLDFAKNVGIKKGLTAGIGTGLLMFIMFSMYGLAFWYGSTLIKIGEIEVGDLLTAFFSVLTGAFSLGQVGSSVEKFASAKAAAFKIFEIIDREPPIDILSDEGHKPDKVAGDLKLVDIDFTYPSRPDVQILKKVNLTVPNGKTTALCGQSGCGKSTCVQLMQRFYDPDAGEILLDGRDIRTLNVKWLREHIGVVSQEPVLFDTTIAENIRYGQLDCTMDDIIEATRLANAFDFINKLPNKFDTVVGEGGAQMSGGQKQRIAIARAIVRNPKILLLDEATSALDTESEAVVQSALDRASQGRTTVVIAHRLSTIKNADQIVGFHEGEALESGSHEELLLLKKGVYQNLVHMQSYAAVDEDESDQEDKKHRSLRKVASDSELRKRTLSSMSSGEKSQADEEEEDKEDDGLDEGDLDKASFGRIMALNRPELGYIIIGCIAAGINGGLQPLFAILFSGILGAFSLPPGAKQDKEITIFSCLFVAIGFAMLIANIVQNFCFATSGERLTKRLRASLFHAMLRQDMSYFDDHRNSTGALCVRLSTDASKVRGATGIRLGSTCQSVLGMGVALGIAFAYSWQLTLLTIAFTPLMAIAGVMQAKILTGQASKEMKSFEEAGKIATETTINIRTVASLTREEYFFTKYKNSLVGPFKTATKKAVSYGFSFGFSQAIAFFAYAAAFRFGAYLVEQGAIEFDNVFKVLMAVIFGAFSVGQASSFAPDYADAKVSSARIFKLLDREPAIDNYSDSGSELEKVDGDVEYKSIKFNYPTRPDFLVLKGLNLTIKPGQTVALVGQSGCGKSTCIQLIERFYDPVEGVVQICERDIQGVKLSSLRGKMGIVSQEPILFDRSIASNIRYGDCSREASMDEVIAAAKGANIHDFIKSLPQEYETNAGSKGAQLSGGQKQRIAIARSLLRNPKILLLDEATSALDAESEKIVQDALDAASDGRTCIIIAHRLSTIVNADVIAVLENGVVVESGTHHELLAKQGSYFSLVNAQLNRKKN